MDFYNMRKQAKQRQETQKETVNSITDTLSKIYRQLHGSASSAYGKTPIQQAATKGDVCNSASKLQDDYTEVINTAKRSSGSRQPKNQDQPEQVHSYENLASKTLASIRGNKGVYAKVSGGGNKILVRYRSRQNG